MTAQELLDKIHGAIGTDDPTTLEISAYIGNDSILEDSSFIIDRIERHPDCISVVVNFDE